MEFVIYFLMGLLVGGLSGLLGIGGGLIIVPSLYFIFEYKGMNPDSIMHLAAGTSLAAMIIATGTSVWAYTRKGAEIWPIFKQLILGIMIGTITGGILADYIPSKFLSRFFGVFILFLSLRLIFPPTKGDKVQRLPNPYYMFLISSLIGMSSGLFGIGGGMLVIPFLTHCQVPMKNILGTSVSVGFVASMIGTITFILVGWDQPNLPPMSLGYIYLPAAIGIALGCPLLTNAGASLAMRLPDVLLKRLFGLFMAIVALKIIFV